MIFLFSVSKAIFPEEPHGMILHSSERMTSGVGGNRVISAFLLCSCHKPRLTRLCLGQCQGTLKGRCSHQHRCAYFEWRVSSWYPLFFNHGKGAALWNSHRHDAVNVFKLKMLSVGGKAAIEDSDWLDGAGNFIIDINVTDRQTLQCFL